MPEKNFEHEVAEFWKNLAKEERDRLLQAQETSYVIETLMAYAYDGTINPGMTVVKTLTVLKFWRDKALELKDDDNACALQHVLDFIQKQNAIWLTRETLTLLEVIDLLIQKRAKLMSHNPETAESED